MTRPHPLGRLASYGTPVALEPEPERTPGGLLESEVEAIMAQRVAVWALKKAKARVRRVRVKAHTRRLRWGPNRWSVA